MLVRSKRLAEGRLRDGSREGAEDGAGNEAEGKTSRHAAERAHAAFAGVLLISDAPHLARPRGMGSGSIAILIARFNSAC